MQQLLLLIMINIMGCSSNDKVYLCNGPQSKVYHKTNNCQGLRRCTTDIESTDITTAKERHIRECGILL